MLAWDCLEVRNRIRIPSNLSPSISLELIQPPPFKIEARWTQKFSIFFLWHKKYAPSSRISSRRDLIKKVKARVVLVSILAFG